MADLAYQEIYHMNQIEARKHPEWTERLLPVSGSQDRTRSELIL